LVDGTIVYVQFNDHGEYAYMVRFSYLSNDACRFDNYDNTWKVCHIISILAISMTVSKAR
jgi:hypothetical protein